MPERSHFLLLMLLLGVVGISLSILGHSFHLLPVSAVGEALAVAGILGATVDPFLKAKLTAETFDAALRAVVGKDPEEPIRAELRRIALCDTVREEFEVEYQFSEPINNSVLVSQFVTYRVRNTGSGPRDFKHILWVSDAAGSKFNLAKCVRGKEVVYDYTGDTLKPQPEDEGWRWEQVTTMAPGETLRIKSKVESRFPLVWEETFYFMEPTIGARVRIIAPPAIKAHVIYHHEDKLKTDTFVSGTWELLGAAFLPHMSFTVGWKVGSEQHSPHTA